MRIISPADAYRAWQAGELAIIDVREPGEHDATRLADVPLVPMGQVPERVDEIPSDRPLAVICRSGARSGRVADYLTGNGAHGEVANIDGGLLAWAADGLPYEGDPPH
jgi:rhodanese-related sulfurtransferase